MSSIIRSLLLSLAAASIATLGCTSTSTPSDPSESSPTPVSDTQDTGNAHEVSATLAPVYFDTDLATLRPDARAELKRFARSILDHPEWGVVRIEGHCDERGGDGYNLALGKRRAAAVAGYLVDQGVARERLTTETFGARRPAIPGHDEAAWRYNRRSELRIADVLASTEG